MSHLSQAQASGTKADAPNPDADTNPQAATANPTDAADADTVPVLSHGSRDDFGTNRAGAAAISSLTFSGEARLTLSSARVLAILSLAAINLRPKKES